MGSIDTLLELQAAIEGRNPVFMFIGRTTPPTPGHLSVFLEMIRLRRELGRPEIPILLNLSPSSPTKIKKGTKFQDPLFCDKKIEYIRKMLINMSENEHVYPVCLDRKENELRIFRQYQLADFIDKYPHPIDMVVVFIGKDRYKGPESLINYTIISRLPVVVYVRPRDVKTDATSGTRIRELIMSNENPLAVLPELKRLYTMEEIQLLSDDELIDLHQMVHSGMTLGLSETAPKKTRSVKAETSKTRDRKEDSEEPSRKTRSSKSRGRKVKRTKKRYHFKFFKNSRK
jgi:hypothetical protein